MTDSYQHADLCAGNGTSANPSREWHAEVESTQGDELKDYSRLKLALASQLHGLRGLFNARGNEQRKRQCDELLAKLADDRFTLAVMGQFKRGKSSLLNAILGRELLPTGVLPLTSAITILKFGPRERLVIQRAGSPLVEEASPERLADYVTQRGNPANCLGVKSVTVEVPSPYLRRGLEFVDTPGIGSAIAANTATTYAFLPSCDAVLLVTSVDSPWTSAEAEFLQSVRQHVDKTFFVVNKIDLLSDSDRNEVLKFVGETIMDQAGEAEVKLYPVSCQLALEGKQTHDEAIYHRSGLKELEAALARFLANEKTTTFLTAIADKALRILEAESSEQDFFEPARRLPRSILNQKLAEVRDRWQRNNTVRRAIFQQFFDQARQKQQATWLAHVQSTQSAEKAKFSARLDRLLDHCSWQLCAVVSPALSAYLGRQLRRYGSRLWSKDAGLAAVESDERCRGRWRELQLNLADISGIAAEVFDIRRVDSSIADCLPSFHFPPQTGAQPLPESPATSSTPLWATFLPVKFARARLRKRLHEKWIREANSIQGHVLGTLEAELHRNLERLSDDLNTAATHAERCVLSAIEGRPANAPLAAPELEDVRQRIIALRGEIWRPTEVGVTTPVIASPPQRPASVTEMPTPEADIAHDLRARGCLVCNHLHRVAFDSFRHWQYALSIDEKAQDQFASELGFCPVHAWQLETLSSPVGSSIAYAKLAGCIAHLLSETAHLDPNLSSARLPPLHACRVCRLLADAERVYSRRLAEFIHGPEERDAYIRSQGPCLRHLSLLCAIAADDELGRFLLVTAAHRFEEVAEDMQAFAMKTDALRRELRNADEEDAYWRTITHLVGDKRLVLPRQDEIDISG